MPRTIWKGAIAFGLVHIPIVVYAATRPHRLDFDWIDRRDDSPVGYQRINKRTGKSIAAEDIVKGYEYEKGEYVYLSDEDFRRANVAATQTVDVQGFVDAAEIPIFYYDTPYYLAPDRRGAKGYALLRDVLRKSGRLGLARVVLHTREHLCALLPQAEALMLITLRYADEILPAGELELPAPRPADAPTPREKEMALRLVQDMAMEWDPDAFRDEYREDLLDAIDRKIKAGKTHVLTEAGEAPARRSAKVIDLMAMLKQSIESRGGKPSAARKKAASAASAGAGAAKARARKTGARSAPSRRKAA